MVEVVPEKRLQRIKGKKGKKKGRERENGRKGGSCGEADRTPLDLCFIELDIACYVIIFLILIPFPHFCYSYSLFVIAKTLLLLERKGKCNLLIRPY